MPNFFNPNAAFDPNNPQNYDYSEQARQLQMRQALAQQLNKPLDQGKMVGGWYVAPSQGAAIASALQQALGGYMNVKNSEAEGELSKSDRDAAAYYRKQYQDANDPSKYIDKAREASPIPQDQYTYKHPEQVGPSMDELNGVQTFPVKPQTPDQSRPLGPLGQTLAANKGNLAQQANAQAQQVLASYTPEKQAADPQGYAQAQQYAARTQASLGRVAPAAPATQAPAAPEPTFNVASPSADEVNAAKVGQIKYLQKAMGADRESALDSLSRTKAGGPLAQALIARDFAPAEYKTAEVKNADGSSSLVAYDSRNPSNVFKLALGNDDGGAKGAKAAAELKQGDEKNQREWIGVAQSAAKNLNDTKTQINAIDSSLTGLNAARDLLSKVKTGPWAQYWTKSLSAIGVGSGDVKALQSYFQSSAFQQAKNVLQNNISDSDAKAFVAASPDLSWTPDQIANYMDRFERLASENRSTLAQTAAQHQADLDTSNTALHRPKGSATAGSTAPKGADLFPPR